MAAPRSREHVRSIASLAQDASVGLGVGIILEGVAMEGWVHQALSHRTVVYSPPLAAAARAAMIACCMSPNRVALHHRLHHRESEVSPLGVIDSLRHVAATVSGNSAMLKEPEHTLTFPGYKFDDDPLIRRTPEGLAFRTDPLIERLASTNPLARAVPLLAAAAGIGYINRRLGRDRPFVRGAVLAGGVAFAAGAEMTATSYAEARSGIQAGKFDIKGALAKNLRRHQEHHDDPARHSAGTKRRYQVMFRALHKCNLIRPTTQIDQP